MEAIQLLTISLLSFGIKTEVNTRKLSLTFSTILLLKLSGKIPSSNKEAGSYSVSNSVSN